MDAEFNLKMLGWLFGQGAVLLGVLKWFFAREEARWGKRLDDMETARIEGGKAFRADLDMKLKATEDHLVARIEKDISAHDAYAMAHAAASRHNHDPMIEMLHKIDNRLARIEEKFEAHDSRLEAIEERVRSIESLCNENMRTGACAGAAMLDAFRNGGVPK